MFQADDSDDDEGEEVSEVDLLQVSWKTSLHNIFRYLIVMIYVSLYDWVLIIAHFNLTLDYALHVGRYGMIPADYCIQRYFKIYVLLVE